MSVSSPFADSGLLFRSSSLYKAVERKADIFLNPQMLSARVSTSLQFGTGNTSLYYQLCDASSPSSKRILTNSVFCNGRTCPNKLA